MEEMPSGLERARRQREQPRVAGRFSREEGHLRSIDDVALGTGGLREGGGGQDAEKHGILLRLGGWTRQARNSPAGLLRGQAGSDPARAELPDEAGHPRPRGPAGRWGEGRTAFREGLGGGLAQGGSFDAPASSPAASPKRQLRSHRPPQRRPPRPAPRSPAAWGRRRRTSTSSSSGMWTLGNPPPPGTSSTNAGASTNGPLRNLRRRLPR